MDGENIMELIPNNEVFQTDKRNTKKIFLVTDAICAKCGIIFNSSFEKDCIVCESPNGEDNKIIENEKNLIERVEEARQYAKKVDGHEEDTCDHKDFIVGRQSVDLRVLLDFHIEDLKALCDIHGCSEGGSRGKMVINILKQLYPLLDKRINENLVRKMIFRNRKKFRFWRDIECAISKAKRSERIKLVDADDCVEITEINKK